MKYLAIVSLLFLTTCQSEEEKKADWVKFCVDGEFTPKQCNVLYSIVKNSNDNSDTNAAMTSIAIGMSAGAKR